MTWLHAVYLNLATVLPHNGVISGGYEITSFIGSLLAAHFAGKLFKSDNVVTCIFLIAVLVCTFCLLLTFGSNSIVMAAMFFIIGFSINIVQTLFVIEACSMGDNCMLA